jgi:hypothetical protein
LHAGVPQTPTDLVVDSGEPRSPFPAVLTPLASSSSCAPHRHVLVLDCIPVHAEPPQIEAPSRSEISGGQQWAPRTTSTHHTSPPYSPRSPASRPNLAVTQKTPERRRSKPPARPRRIPRRNPSTPVSFSPPLTLSVRSRSSGSDGSTYPKGYGSIGSVQIHFNPTHHRADPHEPVPTNHRSPRGQPQIKIEFK